MLVDRLDLADVERCDTLPKLLAHNAARFGAATAMCEKQLGIWRALTWSDVQGRVKALALGLHRLGLGAGDVVALIGDNRPDWVCGELAAHAIGGLSLGLYRDALEDEVAYLLDYAQVKLVFAEDEEQVDKLLALGGRIRSVQHIVYADARGLGKRDDARLLKIAELAQQGENLARERPGFYEELVAAGSGESCAILCTTSGTTANPKLAMLAPKRLLAHCAAYLAVDPKDSTDQYVSILPLPWIMEQVYAVGKWLLCRMTVNFVEEPETAMHDFREIGASFVLFAPRQWEAIAADVRAQMLESTWLKRRFYDVGMGLALHALDRGRRSWLADLILFRALKDRLGLSRLRSAATGGAALGPDTFRFFLAMGVPLRQLYGQTELLGAYTIHRAGEVDFDSVGPAFNPAIEIRIDDPDANGVGEIVTRHQNMFLGYYKNEAATAADLRGGWMHSGDAGFFKDGRLVVIDRIRDIAATRDGVRFSPQYIENKLKFSPYIAEAVILGHERDYPAAIICIRFPVVAKWAERNRIAFTTLADLAARPDVYALVRQEVEKTNHSLPPAQRIRKFLLLYKELDADDGELTRTRKVRRGVINEKYADIIDAIYADRPSVEVDTTIVFQDGNRQRIRTTLRVIDLAPAAAAQAA